MSTISFKKPLYVFTALNNNVLGTRVDIKIIFFIQIKVRDKTYQLVLNASQSNMCKYVFM